MNTTVIYLQEMADGRIGISAETLGEKNNATLLACQLMEGMTLIENVFFAESPKGIAARPMVPLIQ